MSPPVALLVDRSEGVIAVDLDMLSSCDRQRAGEGFARGVAGGGWIVLDEEAVRAALRRRAPTQVVL
jgi:hypothetical protein